MKKVSLESAPYNTSQLGNLSHHEEASETCSFHSDIWLTYTPGISWRTAAAPQVSSPGTVPQGMATDLAAEDLSLLTGQTPRV